MLWSMCWWKNISSDITSVGYVFEFVYFFVLFQNHTGTLDGGDCKFYKNFQIAEI